MKKIKIYLYIFLFSLIFTIFLFELYAKYRTDLFPSYGWQKNNTIKDNIIICDNKKNIGVFGDSFVEYFGKDNNNLVRILDSKFRNYKVCNFGFSGDSIHNYIARFLYVLKSDVKLEKAIFYLYEGNDFYEFRYTNDLKNIENLEIKGETIFNYSEQTYFDRNLSFTKNFIKSTFTLNLIYRELYKKYFTSNRVTKEFVQKIYTEDKYYEVKLDKAIERMNNTPKDVKKLLSADILNINFYSLALRNPNYFNEIYNPEEDKFEIQKIIASKYVKFINKTCINNEIECKFIIIPSDQFLFEEAKNKYQNLFRFNFQKEYGKSKISNFLLTNFDNIYYPESLFIYEDFINNDMHLNANGNKKLATFTYEKF
ncbi:hypothetical protein N8963_02645 [Candidatus Pelagibacter sp.]|nr:hypothetical protein [Candidatus Pelagibacter sp.]